MDKLVAELSDSAVPKRTQMGICWVKFLDDLLVKHGAQTYGDDCSLTTHLVQAGVLAEKMMESCTDKHLPETFVLEAFLHDVADLFRPPNTVDDRDQPDYGHAQIGSALTTLMVKDSLGLTEHHGAAKRFLIAYSQLEAPNEELDGFMKEVLSGPFSQFERSLKNYFGFLSQMSLTTSLPQGGRMDLEAMRAFAKQPRAVLLVQLRLIDDHSKEESCETKPYHFYPDLVESFNGERFEALSLPEFVASLTALQTALQTQPLDALKSGDWLK